MDVLCVGMYRACSTWQYEVAADLVERFRGGQRLGYVGSREYRPLDQRPANAPTEWRVLKSHEGGPSFSRALNRGHAVALYAIRDARDVVYSMLHKRQTGFEAFLREGMIHQLLANDRFWRRQSRERVLVQRYEELIENPIEGVARIASFLGLPVDRGDLTEIAEKYSFEANKARTAQAARQLISLGLNPGDPANATRYDAHSLLHWNHLRNGKSGSWRDSATDREHAVLHKILGRWLTANGYASEQADTARWLPVTSRDRASIARGWLACALRCAAYRYPRTGKIAKRILRIDEPNAARAIAVAVEQSNAEAA